MLGIDKLHACWMGIVYWNCTTSSDSRLISLVRVLCDIGPIIKLEHGAKNVYWAWYCCYHSF